MSASTSPTAPQSPGRSEPGEPAWEVALLFPVQGSWSEDDYLELGTNRLVEFSDGCLEVLPMPTIFHQLIVKFLYGQLESFIKTSARGDLFFAPLPIRLRPGKYREPDLVYFRPGRIAGIHGQPDGADLVVEVVSDGPENRKRDHETKRREYAEAGIAEYWIVDPQDQLVTVLSLHGKSYREHGIFSIDTIATSLLVPGFSVAVKEVFSVGQR